MPARIAKRIFTAILNAQHILLIPHRNPDGDALGSITAIMEYLKNGGKKYHAFCATDISTKFDYLPHIDEVGHDPTIFQDPSIDLIITCDSGDLRYAGVDQYIARMNRRPLIANIDHHPTNEQYGDMNLVIPSAASATEIVYTFFHVNHIPVNSNMATSLLTGLITDTDNFTNGATSASSLSLASTLLHLGGNIKQIQEEFIRDKTLNALKVWGAVLGRLKKQETLNIVYTYVTQEDLRRYHVTEAETEGLANFLNNLEEGRAGMILKENEDGSFKGSFRTTRDDTNVSQWALALGGGGHVKASGFRVDGPIERAIETVFHSITNIK